MKKLAIKHALRLGLIVSFLAAFLPVPALAQDADDDFENTDPCRGDPQNPVVFELFPQQAAPGGSFLIGGKPHDPRTVGPGSDVSFNWQKDSTYKTYSARVNDEGKFVGMIFVPKDFPPGKHVLQYAEASPFTSCLEFTVISAAEAAETSEIRKNELFIQLLGLLMRLSLLF